jgi:rubrerythrin
MLNILMTLSMKKKMNKPLPDLTTDEERLKEAGKEIKTSDEITLYECTKCKMAFRRCQKNRNNCPFCGFVHYSYTK